MHYIKIVTVVLSTYKIVADKENVKYDQEHFKALSLSHTFFPLKCVKSTSLKEGGRRKSGYYVDCWCASPDCGQRDGAHVVAGFSVASITVTSPLAGTRDFSVLKLPGNSQDPSLTTTHGSPVLMSDIRVILILELAVTSNWILKCAMSHGNYRDTRQKAFISQLDETESNLSDLDVLVPIG